MSYIVQKQTEVHKHKFKQKTKNILVNAGRITAKDKLYYHECDCGHIITYDLERLVK